MPGQPHCHPIASTPIIRADLSRVRALLGARENICPRFRGLRTACFQLGSDEENCYETSPVCIRAACGLVGIVLAMAGCSAKQKGAVVMGEHLTTRQIIDRQQGGLVLGVVAVPEKWRFSSDVTWNYADNSNPVRVSTTAENPANTEAVFGYPAALFFYLRPGGSYYVTGKNYGGLIFSVSQPPLPTLAAFIRRARAGVQKLQFVGSKDLPELPAALQIPRSPNQHGLGVKVTYEINGAPVEEEFYTVWDSIDIPYDGPQGRTWQINWDSRAYTASGRLWARSTNDGRYLRRSPSHCA